MPAPSRYRPLRLLALAVALLGCYQDPEVAMDQQQLLTDLGDSMNELALQTAELTAQLDSLRMVVARQDTLIYRMANVTGIPYQLR